VFGAAILASIAVFGWEDNLNWFEVNIVQYSQRWLAAVNDQSIPSFIFRLQAGPELMLDWKAYLPPRGAELPALILTGLLYVVVLLSCIRSPDPARRGEGAQADLRRDLQYLLASLSHRSNQSASLVPLLCLVAYASSVLFRVLFNVPRQVLCAMLWLGGGCPRHSACSAIGILQRVFDERVLEARRVALPVWTTHMALPAGMVVSPIGRINCVFSCSKENHG
jgi:hypothetical protein